jgi:hypothetical protein
MFRGSWHGVVYHPLHIIEIEIRKKILITFTKKPTHMKITKVPIPIYFGFLKIIITEDPDFKDVNQKYNTRANNCFSAFTFQDSKTGHYCIAFPPTVELSSICHECCHLVNMVFDYIGQKTDTSNDEAQCYFMGWMFKQVETALNKYKLDNKEKVK